MVRPNEVARGQSPPPLRYAMVVYGVCVELRDGRRAAAESCGDGFLHRTMNQLRALGQLYEFSEGQPCQREDLGMFYIRESQGASIS